MRLVFVLGTRPELIKCAPVVLAARERGHDVTVISSGQHREMLKPLFMFFGFQPDCDLDVMVANQGLTGLSARVLQRLDLNKKRFEGADWVLVQGDTTTAAMAGYWAFCQRLRVAHIEAGLRTHDLAAPFPEEANRQLLGRISALHLAPTSCSVQALRKENVPASRILRVGNTSIDALLYTLKRIDLIKVGNGAGKSGDKLLASLRLPKAILRFAGKHRIVLVTAHRRESFGPGLERICRGILLAAKTAPEARFVFPMHPNPQVRGTVVRLLGGHSHILLCEPLPYIAFAELMRRADVLLTDSGGVQEEGPTLRKPILVLRHETERPEGVQAGFARLVGTDPKKIQSGVRQALLKGCQGRGRNPYGDGKTAERILSALKRALR
jgi:UDP-N-acetylglucosamine 2-epimerase (non-hydrolysing)